MLESGLIYKHSTPWILPKYLLEALRATFHGALVLCDQKLVRLHLISIKYNGINCMVKSWIQMKLFAFLV